MLQKGRVAAALPAQDIDRAKGWYRDKLGMEPMRTEPDGGAVYEGGDGTYFLVFPSMGKASGDHTQIGFEVDDVEATVEEMSRNGVVFEQYDFPELKTDDRGIAEIMDQKGAWFKDSEGNLLSVGEYQDR